MDADDTNLHAGTQTDEALMSAFARGDPAAFEQLFARYKQPLFGFFRRRLPDPARAEELTQETFLAVLRAARGYKPTASFRTFLYGIGLNLLRSDRRKAAFRATFTFSPPASEPPPEAVAPGHAEAELLLRDALRHLDHQDREVLMLREFEELSYAGIAALLRIPVNTVRSRLFRARAALRTVLTAPAPQPSAATAQKERV